MIAQATNDEPRIGVFVCDCGLNIAGTVDCGAVAEHAKTLPGVVSMGVCGAYLPLSSAIAMVKGFTVEPDGLSITDIRTEGHRGIDVAGAQ